MEKLINQLHKKLANLKGQKIAFVLEGRDASGKGGFVKLLINFDIPFIYRHQGMPTQTRMKKWLSDYERSMPRKNELVIYDRSWHTRSWVHAVYNFQYLLAYTRLFYNSQEPLLHSFHHLIK